MKISITHLTEYHYEHAVPYGLQELRLTPQSDSGQNIERWNLRLDGGEEQAQFLDQHGNKVMLISLEADSHRFAIRCEGEVETIDSAGVVGPHGGYAPLWLYLRDTDLTRAGPGIEKLARGVGKGDDGDVGHLHKLAAAITDAVAFEVGRTDAETTAEAALAAGHGVCQDQTHIFLAAARLLGYPARYVSGYLLMENQIEQEASHAWAEAHIEGLGWVGFDPVNRISPDERYIRMAYGLDYAEAAPISGVRFGKSPESLNVSIQVQQ
ncbi:MAG: transglutaminase family protein [Parvularculaceae bacterium]|nr:transglutaminase family protein [Parvularculaceae bacterium]